MMILRRERVSSESLLGCIDDDTLWKVKAVKCGFRVFECRTFDCCVHFLASKMGNGASAPKNKVGKRVVREKVENAKKTGVLSLQEHGLDDIPKQLFELTNLSTLDLSKNKLDRLDQHQHGLAKLSNLKSLNCEFNKLQRGTLTPIAHLDKLQTLSLGNNRLGHDVPLDKDNPSEQQPDCLPPLPTSLKQLKLNTNHMTMLPPQICSPSLSKLQKLDLSFNHLASVPAAIGGLVSLVEINLDSNMIVALPEEMGKLKKLKSLSLKNNSISVESTNFHPARNPQPLPAALFTETPLTDLNLAGNKLTNTALNEFEGFDKFLERRQKVKTKGVYGGALTNLSVCGLD